MKSDELLTAARQACNESDPAIAEELVTSILTRSEPAEDLINIGIACRDLGRSSLAFRIFKHISQKWPSHVPAYYEAAFAHRLAGGHLNAARLLLQAKAYAPHDVRLATFLVHMLHAVGAHDEAAREHKAVIPLASDVEAEQLEAIREFGSYLAEWPLGRAMLLLDRVQSAYTYLDTHQIADRIIDALDSGRPFALIRLGDGEGSCIGLGREDEARFPHLYRQNRSELNSMWFGQEFCPEESGFTALSRKIVAVSMKSDVVGIPYEGWISHEYKIASLRGIPSLVNILRAFDALSKQLEWGPALCSQLTHMDLHRTGQLERIVRHARRVSVISCLPELPELLRRSFELEEVALYRIPGEKGSAAALGIDAVAGSHYPDLFAKTQRDLERTHDGRLVLVAGGILGKFYAETVKAFGGVALDIGSVADGWACKMTRPGISARMGLSQK